MCHPHGLAFDGMVRLQESARHLPVLVSASKLLVCFNQADSWLAEFGSDWR